VLAEVDDFVWNAKCSGVLDNPDPRLLAKMCAYRPVTNDAATGRDIVRITTLKEAELVRKFRRCPSLEALCRPFSEKLVKEVDASAARDKRRPRGARTILRPASSSARLG